MASETSGEGTTRARVAASLAFVLLLAGCSTLASPATPTEIPSDVERQEVDAGMITLTNLTVSPAFEIRSQQRDWEFPTRIEFQRYHDGNWTDAYARLVREGETIEPELSVDVHYRIVVVDNEGDRRYLGPYTPKQGDELYTLIIGQCCVDDFSREVASDG